MFVYHKIKKKLKKNISVKSAEFSDNLYLKPRFLENLAFFEYECAIYIKKSIIQQVCSKQFLRHSSTKTFLSDLNDQKLLRHILAPFPLTVRFSHDSQQKTITATTPCIFLFIRISK